MKRRIVFVLLCMMMLTLCVGCGSGSGDYDIDEEVAELNKAEQDGRTDPKSYTAVKHETLNLVVKNNSYTITRGDEYADNNCDNMKTFGITEDGKYRITVDAIEVTGWSNMTNYVIRKLYDYEKLE